MFLLSQQPTYWLINWLIDYQQLTVAKVQISRPSIPAQQRIVDNIIDRACFVKVHYKCSCIVLYGIVFYCIVLYARL